MPRIVFAAVLALATAPALAQQTAGEVYQWTDASGVTHYSQTPPAGGRYTQRVITSAGTPAPAAATADAATPAENPNCTAARANIAALEGTADVTQDTDGDGKPDTVLDAGQRAAQLDLARAAAKAYCTN